MLFLLSVGTVGNGDKIGGKGEGVHNAADDAAGVIVVIVGNDDACFAGKFRGSLIDCRKVQVFSRRKMAP